MKIQISGLSEGIHQYQFTVEPEDLELGNEFRSPVVVDATLDKTPNQILLTSNIHVRGSFNCDRCVSTFETELTPAYRTFYAFEGTTPDDLDPAEFQVISPSQTVIDMAEDVRQTVLLAVPLKLLCNEGCRGLCPSCGKNLNDGPCSCKENAIDPRWEQLRRLQGNY